MHAYCARGQSPKWPPKPFLKNNFRTRVDRIKYEHKYEYGFSHMFSSVV